MTEMGAAWAWASTERRRRWRSTAALVLLIGLSGAVVLTAAAGARRTDSAFARFLESSNTADVQVQYTAGADIDDEVLDALRRHPDIEAAVSLYFTVAFSQDSQYVLPILASSGLDLFHEVDRPKVLEGRLPDPTAADEVLINPFTQDILGVEVGDTVRVGTLTAEQFGGEGASDPAGPMLELRVVGVRVSPYDLADPEFTGLVATPAYFEAHWGEVGGYGPTFEVTTRGDRDPKSVIEDALRGFRFDEIILTDQASTAAKVEDGTRVLAIGLATFAAVASLASLVACAQALYRRLSDSAPDQPTLRAMGLSRLERVVAMGLTVVPAVVAGVGLAALLAIPASWFMPIGTARDAEPSPGIDVDGTVLILGAALFTFTLVIVGVMSASRVARAAGHGPPSATPARRRPSPARLVGSRLSPAAHLGMTMALDPGAGRTAVPVRSALIGAGVGAAGIMAVLTFGASLDSLVDEPARSGWNWTLAPDIADDEVDDLMAIPGVEDVGQLVHRQVIVDGQQMLGIAVHSNKGAPSLTVIRGRMPAGPREIAVGPKLADRAELRPRDAVEMTDTAGGTREMVVVGEVLFPTFDDDNPFNDGVAVAPEVIDDLAVSDGFSQAIVGFAPSVSRDEAARRIDEALPDALSVYAYPSLPPDVAHLDAVRFLPRLLGLFLGLLAVGAVGHALVTSVHRRRRDFGIVRSLGFRRADVIRATIAQSFTLVLVGLAVGLPLGVVIGRVSWRLLAERIGVSDTPTVPLIALVALASGALLAGAALAGLPARAATRIQAATALRVE